MKTIIHIDNSPNITGAYKALYSFCESYPARHIWVLPKGSQAADDARKQWQVYELPFVEIGRSVSKLIRYLPALLLNAKRLQKIIDKEKPDLIHNNDLYNLVSLYTRAARTIPVVTHVRMLKRSFPQKIYNFWMGVQIKRASMLIGVSEAIMADWQHHPKMSLLYDPIDILEKHSPKSYNESETSELRFLCLANYMNGKGQMDVLEAYALFLEKSERPSVLHFYGGTLGLEKNEEFKRRLAERAKTLKIDHLIEFHGAVSNVEHVMKQFDVLLHFSHLESFGMVCYEALYYGLPVISTRCGGPQEMIEDGVTGLLVDVSNQKQMADAMARTLSNISHANAMARKAQSHLKEEFGSAGKKIQAYFTALLQKASFR